MVPRVHREGGMGVNDCLAQARGGFVVAGLHHGLHHVQQLADELGRNTFKGGKWSNWSHI